MGKNLVKEGFSRCWGGEVQTNKFSGSGETPLSSENSGSCILVFSATSSLGI